MNDSLSLSATEKDLITSFSRLEENQKDAFLAMATLMHIEESAKEAQKRLRQAMGWRDINKTTYAAQKIINAIENSNDPEKAADIAISIISSYIAQHNTEPLKGDSEPEALNAEEISLLTQSNDDAWMKEEWTEYPSFEAVTENRHSDTQKGYIYVAEFGEYVKIGYSIHPQRRLSNHASTAKNYGNIKTGRVLLSPAHKNYIVTERNMHEYYKDHRKAGTELFEVSFDDVARDIMNGQLLEMEE